MLLGAGHGGVEGNPVASELLRVIQNFRLPVEPAGAPGRGASVRPLQRSDADAVGARRLRQRHLVGRCSRWQRASPDRRRRNGSSGAPCGPRFRLRAGDQCDAARRRAAAIVRAAATPGKAWQRHGAGVCGKADPAGARCDRRVDRCGTAASRHGIGAACGDAPGVASDLPAAGDRESRSDPAVAGRQRSLCAAFSIALFDPMGDLAGVAVGAFQTDTKGTVKPFGRLDLSTISATIRTLRTTSSSVPLAIWRSISTLMIRTVRSRACRASRFDLRLSLEGEADKTSGRVGSDPSAIPWEHGEPAKFAASAPAAS